MPSYLPIALRLDGRRCVVVGGGQVAARRTAALLEAGAEVTVVAPEVCPTIADWAASGRVAWAARPYSDQDLKGAALAVAATDCAEVNARVAADARRERVLCNDAEDPARGDFVVPSALRRGGLLIAATTCGASPALAARVRDELAQRYGPEYASFVELLAELREQVLARVADPGLRRRMLAAAASDETILAMIRDGRADEARQRALLCISSS